MVFVLCSCCFSDQGLKLDAERIGEADESKCLNCGLVSGRKLTKEKVATLAHRFFVWGTLQKGEYGAAPIVQFNEQQETNINTSNWLEKDIKLICSTLGGGFFYYGPPLWMLGEVGPLKALKENHSKTAIIQRIIDEYPSVELGLDSLFYRIRKNPKAPNDKIQYDAPPEEFLGRGRLDSMDFPVMYGSPSLEVCLHECRVTAEDEIYFASLVPTRTLKLLDLSYLLPDDHVTSFESLDMSVYMLFLAGEHSYPISREIAKAALTAGFDGLIYSSYFSLLFTGSMPFETIWGISNRCFPQMREYEQAKSIPNYALFGRPIAEQKVSVHCINKLILTHVNYGFHFGPSSISSQ
jgi:hypothetical protein